MSPIQAAVVDTRAFQRLRYIRQNGLLHFVFPGAVHTRFIHSVGTMALACRAFDRLVPVDKAKNRGQRIAHDYVRTAFSLAALLHDIGHCAFSHSIEHVSFKGEPLLGTAKDVYDRWKENDLLEEYAEAHCGDHEIDVAGPVTHEQIGLAIVRRIFLAEGVRAACKRAKIPGEHLSRDVRAIMDGSLLPSDDIKNHIEKLGDILASDNVVNLPMGLLSILHDLISGTMDVDRLDYLVRDSFFCGVPYGNCAVDMLLNNLYIDVVEGHLTLLLPRKAMHALEDMLWSRYQLFIQVYNHKTNVGLNAILNSAIEDAIKDDRIDIPRTFEEFMGFTDDYVMSSIIRACLKGELSGTSYAKALVDRRLPKHVREVSPTATAIGTRRALSRRRREIAEQYGLDPEEVVVGEARSAFIKRKSPLPMIVTRDRESGEEQIRPFESASSFLNEIPATHRKFHFFVDRDSHLLG